MKIFNMLLVLLIAALSATVLKAQDIPWQSDGTIVYTDIISFEDSTKYNKDHIYLLARTWFTDNFRNSKNVVAVDDRTGGILQGRGNSDIPVDFGITRDIWPLWFDIKIQIKDGRLKYIVDGFQIQTAANKYNNYQSSYLWVYEIISDEKMYRKNGNIKHYNKSVKDGLVSTIPPLIESFKKALESDVVEEEW